MFQDLKLIRIEEEVEGQMSLLSFVTYFLCGLRKCINTFFNLIHIISCVLQVKGNFLKNIQYPVLVKLFFQLKPRQTIHSQIPQEQGLRFIKVNYGQAVTSQMRFSFTKERCLTFK